MIPSKLEFNVLPLRGGTIALSGAQCMVNNVIFSDEYNPHKVRPWIIGNEYGPLCLVWESCEQEAFDVAYDAGKLAGLSVDADKYEEQCKEECQRAGCEQASHACNTPDGIMLVGNASEPVDTEHAWIMEVVLTPIQERYFAEARGANVDTLGAL